MHDFNPSPPNTHAIYSTSGTDDYGGGGMALASQELDWSHVDGNGLGENYGMG